MWYHNRLSQGILKSGCSLDESAWSSHHEPGSPGMMDARRLLLGYEDSLLEFVLAELSFAEQVGGAGRGCMDRGGLGCCCRATCSA